MEINELPTPDELTTMGQFYGGDKAVAPNGSSYWKFMIYRYKGTYVLENHWNDREEGGWELEQIVKRLK